MNNPTPTESSVVKSPRPSDGYEGTNAEQAGNTNRFGKNIYITKPKSKYKNDINIKAIKPITRKVNGNPPKERGRHGPNNGDVEGRRREKQRETERLREQHDETSKEFLHSTGSSSLWFL